MNATLYFERTFTRGTLKGLTHKDAVTFPTPEACVAWKNAVNAKNARGRLDWFVSDASFQKFDRR